MPPEGRVPRSRIHPLDRDSQELVLPVLCDRISGHNLDAFDRHALVRPIWRMRGRGGNSLQHIVALDEFAKGGVLVIEEMRVSVTNEELAAGRIRVAGARHGNDTPVMMTIVELGFDLVARTARAPTALGV
jgi:hypothetical protein